MRCRKWKNTQIKKHTNYKTIKSKQTNKQQQTSQTAMWQCGYWEIAVLHQLAEEDKNLKGFSGVCGGHKYFLWICNKKETLFSFYRREGGCLPQTICYGFYLLFFISISSSRSSFTLIISVKITKTHRRQSVRGSLGPAMRCRKQTKKHTDINKHTHYKTIKKS